MRTRLAARRALFLLGVSAVALGWSPAEAQSPQGGIVAKGDARICRRPGNRRSAGPRSVRSSTGRASMSRSHKVVFDQPGKSSATLNRVNSVSKSVIRGAITLGHGDHPEHRRRDLHQGGEGRCWRSGEPRPRPSMPSVFGERGVFASAAERPGARVINQGEVTIGETGLAALVGGNVENAGAIITRTGTVALASALEPRSTSAATARSRSRSAAIRKAAGSPTPT